MRPWTDIEALMELAPHEESTVQSISGTAALKEAIGVAVDNLNDEDKWIFNALFIEKLSLRAAGRVMGIPKTSLARRRDYIRRRLIAELAESELVSTWLTAGLGLQRLPTLAEHPHQGPPPHRKHLLGVVHAIQPGVERCKELLSLFGVEH